MTPADLLAAVREYLHLEDDHLSLFTLAVATAALADTGEPLWGLVVGPSGAGKTEQIKLVNGCAHERINELSESGLLSYTKGRNAHATGLLSRLQSPGFVTVTDYSTMLAGSNAGARERLQAHLRDVFDGRLVRQLGQAEPLHWEGRVTFLAAVTPEIDRFGSHAGALGERWTYFRMRPLSEDGRREALRKAQEVATVRNHLRRQAQGIATQLVADAVREFPRVTPSEWARDRLTTAAIVTATARSHVPRDGYGQRSIIGEAAPESPARLVVQLTALHRALLALGVSPPETTIITTRVALDNIPPTRRKALATLAAGEALTSAEIARRITTNRGVVKRALEDLEALGVVTYEGAEYDDDESAKTHKRWYLDGDASEVADAFTLTNKEEVR